MQFDRLFIKNICHFNIISYEFRREQLISKDPKILRSLQRLHPKLPQQ